MMPRSSARIKKHSNDLDGPRGEKVPLFKDRNSIAWAGALLLLVLVAYLPAFTSKFIWDDNAYVTENLTLQSTDGLRRIWFELGATIQYYPLVFTTFWIEHQFWGFVPTGYHAVNVLLHAGSVILLWRLLRKLEIPGAELAAALFAVHPVHVESVAWVTERKNVLSMIFYLLAAHSYMAFAGLGGSRVIDKKESQGNVRWSSYALAMAFFVCALLSKTATVGFPIAMLILIWWRRGRIRIWELGTTVPFFVSSIIAGMVTASVERNHVGAGEIEWSLSWGQRMVLASESLCFYLWKIVWPTDLAFVYQKWEVHAGGWQLFVPLAVIGVMAALWRGRIMIGRGPFAAMLFFVVSLMPVLGFVPFYFMRYSWVADHFQYLASLGPIILIGALLAHLLKARDGNRTMQFVVSATLICGLGGMTNARAGVFHDQETLWKDVLAKSPSAREYAHDNLAVYFSGIGRLDEAILHFKESLKINPGEPSVRLNLALALHGAGRIDEAKGELRETIRQTPKFSAAWANLGLFLAEGRDLAEADKCLRQAISLEPEMAAAHFNLAKLLLRLNRAAEAAAEFQEALRIDPNDAEAESELKRIKR